MFHSLRKGGIRVYSIAIIDDEDSIVSSISRFISQTRPEYRIAGTFSDASEALAYLETSPVDVIITDIQMPRINGLEMIRRLRQIYPDVTILVISGYSEFEYAQKACSYHVRDYLLKPIDWHQLSANLSEIAALLGKSRPTLTNEDQVVQQFFIDLLCREIKDPQEFTNRYQQLPLALLGVHYNGCLLSISVSADGSTAQNPYTSTLPGTILSNLRNLLPQYKSFYLFRSQLRLVYIVLSTTEMSIIPLLSISYSLERALGIKCEIKISTVFRDIQSLLLQPDIATPVLNDATENDLVIQHAKSYIHAHYMESISRDDVASTVYLDSSYFSRVFKQKTGMSFIAYLTQVRMKKAKELLSTQMSIAEIADAVGYQHRNTFISNFKEYSGLTPNDYRKRFLMGETTDE